MFKILFVEPFNSGIGGFIIGILIWITFLFVVLFLGYGIFYLIDSSFLEIRTDTGIVVSKHYSPQQFTTTFISTGKTMVPVTNTIPESWSIKLNVNELYGSINIKKSYYDTVNIGDTVICDYVTGRISNGIYIKEIFD